MKFKEGMTTKDKIEALERQVLVHSMLYYHLNESVISDKEYDHLSAFLAEKIQKIGEIKLRSTQYGYVFYDFDGSTGFDLVDRLTKQDRKCILRIAHYVLNLYKHR